MAKEDTRATRQLRTAIGHVTMAWASLETQLCHILTALMETDTITGLAVGTALDYPRKRDVIRSLADQKLVTEAGQKLLSDFMGWKALARSAIG